MSRVDPASWLRASYTLAERSTLDHCFGDESVLLRTAGSSFTGTEVVSRCCSRWPPRFWFFVRLPARLDDYGQMYIIDNMDPEPIKGRGAADNPANRFERLHYEPSEERPSEERPAPATQFFKDKTQSIIATNDSRSEEHTSELQSPCNLV